MSQPEGKKVKNSTYNLVFNIEVFQIKSLKKKKIIVIKKKNNNKKSITCQCSLWS